ncbi:NAD-dependent epimerase/dehydratase family protein [Anaerovibrio lipolyticus]|uniref:NAD-dependent epimerase/dehydratase family protein n=1 Tax=Anaerovibrio lipolyticus TaxID=82374 RepID=UPI000483CB87|nr:NAD(P)-dependent oxidoreductase [Anaerovibrio lipolyticus]
MNILITGTNGFVGSAIAERFYNKYHIVGCGTKKNSETQIDTYYRWDMGHEEMPPEMADEHMDAIIHVAANKSTNDINLELSYSNIVGTHRLINYCIKQKVKMCTLISGIPILEGTINGKYVYNSKYAPPTMYHVTKASQEMMFEQMEKYGIRVVILRIPSPIGRDMKQKTIFTIFGDRAILGEDLILNGKGSRRQNYIDVRDVAQACEKVLENAEINGIYNLGSALTVSNLDLARKWIETTSSTSKIIFSGNADPTDGQNWEIDIERFEAISGYRQEFQIEDTMRDYATMKRRFLKNE